MFADRVDAGQQLAEKLREYSGPDTVVYGLPRGGVPVARIVADALGSQLDLLVARKVGHPQSPEYAVGAVSEDGQVVWNEEEARLLSFEWRERARATAFEEALRRRDLYCQGLPSVDVAGKTGLIVDDGIATGSTKRLPQLPDVPTVAEQGFAGFEMTQWYGLFAPAGTPETVLARLRAGAVGVHRDEGVGAGVVRGNGGQRRVDAFDGSHVTT